MAELFANVEIGRAPRWPLLSRLLAASVVFHGLLLVAVAYVPTLQSLLKVAGDVAGFEFVDEDYDRSLVGQRATLVKLEPYQKLYYPADYFGTTESPYAPLSPDDPALLSQASPAPAPPPVINYSQPPRPRVIKPAATPTPEASPTPEAIPAPSVIAQATPSPDASPTPDEATRQQEAELDRIAQENGTPRPPRINTRPFGDIARKGKEMVDKGSLNLGSTIDATAEAELNEDGTFKRETVKIEGLAADDGMAQLAQEFVNALSESKVLAVLKGAEQVRMSLKLDQQEVFVRVASEVANADRASQMARAYGFMLAIARKKKADSEEGELYNSLEVSSDGREFVVSFKMPREAAGKMIAEMLAKQQKSAGG